jgi:hypothetical protein
VIFTRKIEHSSVSPIPVSVDCHHSETLKQGTGTSDRLILVMDSFAKARCNAPIRQARMKVPDDHEIAYYHCISHNNQSIPCSLK